MAKFNLADVLVPGKMSNLDTDEMQELSLELIDPNPNNFFSVEENVTDLCESIKLNGLLQPPVVTPSENGRYRLIAGHRRHKALKTLALEQPEKYKTVMCRVARPASPELEELMLIQTNTEARELRWSEKNEAATRTEKILIALQKQGVELPGKMRTHVANIIKASESQIARAKFIAKNLIKPLQGKSGISDSAAYKLAHLPAEQQQELYEHYKKELYMLDGSRIKTYQDNLAAGRKPFYLPTPAPRSCYEQAAKGGQYPSCTHGDVIEAHKKKKLPSWQKCDWRTCCSSCTYRFDCEDVCPTLKKILDKARETESFRVCHALREARKQKGMSEDEAVRLLGISHDQLLHYETSLNHTAASLKRLCELYETTPDQILGFSGTATAPPALLSSGWQPLSENSKPTERQLCTVLVYDDDTKLMVDGRQFCTTWCARWIGNRFVSASNEIGVSPFKIVGWCPLPEPEEGYTLRLGRVDEGKQ